MIEVNNRFYHELGDAWWTADDHMVAFLRAESGIRLDYIGKHLPKSDKPLNILDLGAGGGLISIPLAKLGHRVTAVDISEEALEVLMRKAVSEGIRDNVTTVCADILSPLPLNREYDVVLAMDVLEHVPNPKAVIRHAGDVLKKNGCFLYHTLNQTFWCWLLYLQIAPRLVPHSPDHIHLHRYNIKPAWMRQWLSELGFVNHEQIGAHAPPWQRGVLDLLSHRRMVTPLRFEYCRSMALGFLGCGYK